MGMTTMVSLISKDDVRLRYLPVLSYAILGFCYYPYNLRVQL